MAAKEEKAVDVAALEKKVDGLCAQVRRMQDNWVKFSEKFIGRPVDGKKQGEVGSMRIMAVVAILVMAIVGSVVAAELWDISQGTGTAKFEQTGRTGDITLTVDVVDAKLTASGSMTLTPVVQAASDTSRMSVNAPFYVLEPSGIHTQNLGEGADGQMVTFFNNAATNVIFDTSDSRIDVGASDITLGQTDTLTLISYDGVWYRVSNSDN